MSVAELAPHGGATHGCRRCSARPGRASAATSRAQAVDQSVPRLAAMRALMRCAGRLDRSVGDGARNVLSGFETGLAAIRDIADVMGDLRHPRQSVTGPLRASVAGCASGRSVAAPLVLRSPGRARWRCRRPGLAWITGPSCQRQDARLRPSEGEPVPRGDSCCGCVPSTWPSVGVSCVASERSVRKPITSPT